MPVLKLKLLGQMECNLPSGTPLSLSTRKSEVLLAYLALAPGIRHPRDRLVNLLWSDRGEDQARNSLRQSLSSIKKAFESEIPGLLQIERTTVKLIAGQLQVDTHEFEQLVDDPTLENLSKATELYQGEFLEGIAIRDSACQEWLAKERDRLRRLIVEALSSLSQLQITESDFKTAIESAERLVDYDPLQESGWRLLMTAYHERGDRNHALMAYKRCLDILDKELGVEPEAETNKLHEQIKQGNFNKPTSLDVPAKQQSEPTNKASDPDSNVHSIAILPFDNLSGDPEQEYFSDGITESIILNLSIFPGLQVKSRNSSFAFKQQIKSLGEISKELNVDYIVEGSIRKSSKQIRITVQLIEAASGNQIWGKRYDSKLDNLFELEEELSRSIAATVTGQIESELQRIAIAKGAAGQQSYDLLLSGTYHCYRFNRLDTVVAVEKLNQCLALDPDNLRAHVMLFICHEMDYLERWTSDYLGSFKLAAEHIRKALALGPEIGLVQVFYGVYLTFCGNIDEGAKHIDKALEINPNDPDALTTKALNLEMQGKYESALEMAERAGQLDPYHPWTEWELAASQFLSGLYESALDTIEKSRTAPGFIRIFAVASNVKLGRIDAARQQLQIFMQECRENMLSMPQTLDQWLTYTQENYPFTDPQINRDLIDCLVQAGLEAEVVPQQVLGDTSQQPTILVLPFSNLSGDPEQEYFSKGMTESIILNLSSFSGLKVKSRHTSLAYKDMAMEISEIGEKLGVQYIVEGSIRKHSDQVRITVQLGETRSGNQIWGKRFDAPLENLFTLEEELVRTIVGTISGRIGKELMSAALRKPPRDMQSYDYLMRGLYHFDKSNNTDNAIARDQFIKCLEIDLDNTGAHAHLAMTHLADLYDNWSADRQISKDLCQQHSEKALEQDPDNAYAHALKAELLMFLREFDQAEPHVEKAIELNPTLPESYLAKCALMSATRRHKEALKYADISLQIDPHHPNTGWYAGEAYRGAGEYERAIEIFRSIPYISTSVHGQTAACLAGLGKIEQARSEIKLYHEIAREQMPNYPVSEEDWRTYWYESMPYQHEDDSKTLFDLLLKAGLCD